MTSILLGIYFVSMVLCAPMLLWGLFRVSKDLGTEFNRNDLQACFISIIPIINTFMALILIVIWFMIRRSEKGNFK
jgi:hypothetical protein